MTVFVHGVRYPLDMVPEGVNVLLWSEAQRVLPSSPYKTVNGAWHRPGVSSPVHPHATHFSLMPEEYVPPKLYEEHVNSHEEFYAGGLVIRNSHSKETLLAAQQFIKDKLEIL